VPPSEQRHVDVRDPVSLIDVAPTVLDLVGIARPATFDGRSLRPMVDDLPIPDASGSRPVYSELQFRGGLPTVPTTSQRTAIVLGHLKLIAGTAGEREAYDLARDPRESSPLAADDPARRPLEAELARLTQKTAPPAGPPPMIDAEVKERLRALGYIH
jgi:arylsulfatase A-like enzyme